MSEQNSRYDAIIVGGGPAGLSAAYFFAKKGYSTIVLERGRSLGSKNVYGGKIHSYYIKKLFPDFEGEAPVHRWVSKERFSIVDEDDIITIEFSLKNTSSFTTTLTDFTRWIGKKAETEGAIIINEARVDKLLMNNHGVRGVQVGQETLESNVVIIAEGANRLLLEQSGLASPPRREQLAVGFKEVLSINEEDINERFGLDESEGLSWMFIGTTTNGIPDGGFLYTFKNLVSIGAVVWLGASDKVHDRVYEFAENLRVHPKLKYLFKNASIVEYSCHLTIVDPFSYMPTTFSGPGYMIIGDAAGLIGNLGYTFRGVDYAIYSGYLASEAYEKIMQGENWDIYDKIVRSSSMFREIKKYSRVHEILRDNKILTEYPSLLSDIAKQKLELNEETPKLYEIMRRKIGIRKSISILLDLLSWVRKI